MRASRHCVDRVPVIAPAGFGDLGIYLRRRGFKTAILGQTFGAWIPRGCLLIEPLSQFYGELFTEGRNSVAGSVLKRSGTAP
jgi:hypothetical protein